MAVLQNCESALKPPCVKTVLILSAVGAKATLGATRAYEHSITAELAAANASIPRECHVVQMVITYGNVDQDPAHFWHLQAHGVCALRVEPRMDGHVVVDRRVGGQHNVRHRYHEAVARLHLRAVLTFPATP